MNNDLIGLVAVIMFLGIPLAAFYTFYRVRKLRTDERIAALARGVSVPMEPELSQAARSRRHGILLVCGALGYTLTFTLIARMDSDVQFFTPFGIIPFAIGLGYLVDCFLVRRESKA